MQRTSAGIEEITEAHLSLGVPSTVAFEDHRNRMIAYLARLAENAMPLVGLIMARRVATTCSFRHSCSILRHRWHC